MDILKRMACAGIVPAVVIDKAEDAVPAAKALLNGGIDVMEITFRTAAAAEAIRAVSENCPEMLVGAGTVLDIEQCEKAIDCGSRFIVSPGYDREMVRWCKARDIPIVPGCVSATDIMAAIQDGLQVVKFFPAGSCGGTAAMKALSGPFPQIKFLPTGGVNGENLSEYMAEPSVFAVGGSWICSKKDIAAGSFEKITALCQEARSRALGYEIAHVGINAADPEEALALARLFEKAFGFAVKEGNSSDFASDRIEVMKTPYLGKYGHLAVRTARIDMAVADLEKKGFAVAEETAKYKNGKLTAVYLKDAFGGFAVHLLQK